MKPFEIIEFFAKADRFPNIWGRSICKQAELIVINPDRLHAVGMVRMSDEQEFMEGK